MIRYQVEMQNLLEIEAALGMMKDKSKFVLRAAINNTARQTVPLLVDEAAKEYFLDRNLSKSHVRKTLDVEKATTRTLTALVTSTGRTTELYDFAVRPRYYRPKRRPRGGHTGNVKRSNPPKFLYLKPGEKDEYKAFVVKYKSGHVSIAQRVPGKRMKGNPQKEAIKNLRSTSVPAMLGSEQGVWGVVNPKIYEMLQNNIQEQIQRFLG